MFQNVVGCFDHRHLRLASRRLTQILDGCLTLSDLIFSQHNRIGSARGVSTPKLRLEAAASAVEQDIKPMVAKLLGENPGDDVLQEMIAEADEDRDGEVSFEEFKNVMLQMKGK